MTTEETYQAYQHETEQYRVAKQRIQDLYAEHERVGEQAKRATAGNVQAKLAAIRTACQPIREQIQQAEIEKEQHWESATKFFDAWKGLNNG